MTRSALRPVILHPVSLPDFLWCIVYRCTAPTTVVVCSTRESLFNELKKAWKPNDSSSRPCFSGLPEGDMESSEDSAYPQDSLLLIPTLDLLSRSRLITLSFCSSPEVLHAYLSTYSVQLDDNRAISNFGESCQPMLALLNPISLHTESSTSFSAQGLSRLFASAVEAADRNAQKLVMAECLTQGTRTNSSEDAQQPDQLREMDVDAGFMGEAETSPAIDELNERSAPPQEEADVPENPWARQVPILNISTKRFGLDDTAFAGRSVSISSVAARWCTFETVSTT